MSIVNDLKQIIKQDTIIETATVSVFSVNNSLASVKRAGQTNATKFLPVVSGLSVSTNDVVEIVKLNGNINTAYVSKKIR